MTTAGMPDDVPLRADTLVNSDAGILPGLAAAVWQAPRDLADVGDVAVGRSGK